MRSLLTGVFWTVKVHVKLGAEPLIFWRNCKPFPCWLGAELKILLIGCIVYNNYSWEIIERAPQAKKYDLQSSIDRGNYSERLRIWKISIWFCGPTLKIDLENQGHTDPSWTKAGQQPKSRAAKSRAARIFARKVGPQRPMFPYKVGPHAIPATMRIVNEIHHRQFRSWAKILQL